MSSSACVAVFFILLQCIAESSYVLQIFFVFKSNDNLCKKLIVSLHTFIINYHDHINEPNNNDFILHFATSQFNQSYHVLIFSTIYVLCDHLFSLFYRVELVSHPRSFPM